MIVACYGLYQLGAGYAGLPQGLTYSVIAGGTGHIPASSAESRASTLLILSWRSLHGVPRTFEESDLVGQSRCPQRDSPHYARAGQFTGWIPERLCALGLGLSMFAPRAAGGPSWFIRLGLVAVGATVAVVLASQVASISIENTLSRQFTTSFHANADASTVERTISTTPRARYSWITQF